MNQHKRNSIKESYDSNSINSSNKGSKVNSSSSINNALLTKKLNTKEIKNNNTNLKEKFPKLSGKKLNEELPIKVLVTKR